METPVEKLSDVEGYIPVRNDSTPTRLETEDFRSGKSTRRSQTDDIGLFRTYTYLLLVLKKFEIGFVGEGSSQRTNDSEIPIKGCRLTWRKRQGVSVRV